MTIRQRQWTTAGISLAMVLIAGLAGLYGTERGESSAKDVGKIASAIRNHLEADMMHDALRSDVLLALKSSAENDVAGVDQVAADIEEHSATLAASIEANKGLDLPADVQTMLDEVGPALSAYLAHANKIVTMSGADPAAARREFPNFMASFATLEEEMSKISDAIEAVGQGIAEGVSSEALVLRLVLAAAIGSALLGIAIASLWNIRAIVDPIAEMTGAMVRLADGDKHIAIPSLGRADEIGRMAGAVQIFKENLIRADELAAGQAAEQKRREQRANAMESLCREFDGHASRALKSVVGSVSAMKEAASSMSQVAKETVSEANMVSEVAQSATANVTSVASSTEELASSVSEISRQTSRSNEIAEQAAQQARQTNEQIKGLARAAQKVGDVVQLITDIANQTNLLALNATIEAARAGEAGRGFAVVASEVKNLATQTASATEEITQQINGIQSETNEAVLAIHAIATTIGEINQITSAVAAAVEEQGAATQEIARSVENAANGTREVSQRIKLVTTAAVQTGDAAGELLDESAALAGESTNLEREVERFLEAVRRI